MAKGRGERVVPPTRKGDYVIRHTNSKKGWEDLEKVARNALRDLWDLLEKSPARERSPRHYPLGKDKNLATVEVNGNTYVQWQFKVTDGGRVWYCVDEVEKVVYITHAAVAHPKETGG
jgi:hypothetical protein